MASEPCISDVQKVRRIKTLANRQKLILLADRSSHGWNMVRMYMYKAAHGLIDHQAMEQQGVLRLLARLDHMPQLWQVRYACPKMKEAPFVTNSGNDVVCGGNDILCSSSSGNVSSEACDTFAQSLSTFCMNDVTDESNLAPDVCKGYLSPNVSSGCLCKSITLLGICAAGTRTHSVYGYILPVPEGKVFCNQKSAAFVHREFVSETLTDLLSNGCVRLVPLVCMQPPAGSGGKLW